MYAVDAVDAVDAEDAVNIGGVDTVFSTKRSNPHSMQWAQ